MSPRAVVVGLGAGLLIIVTVVLGCWPGPPAGPEPIVHGKDACARCRMVISLPGWGGVLRDPEQRARKYDDLGCLMQDLQGLDFRVPGVWVETHDRPGLTELTAAVFVRGSRLATPMGYGLVAFAERAGAASLAEAGGDLLAAKDLLGWVEGLSAGRTAVRPVPVRGQQDDEEDDEEAGPQVPRPLTRSDAAAGKAVYLRECSACHGDRADGTGPAAPLLPVAPRNFLTAQFKLRTTPSGEAPATSDVLRTIEKGIPGSGMPSFGFLPETERRQVAAYVLERAGLLDRPEPRALPLVAPPPVTAASVARGKEVYGKMGCAHCHGTGGRGDGPSSKALLDEDGKIIPVRDLTLGVFRGGGERTDLYMRFTTGMNGTPMPSFQGQLDDADRFALVDYMQSLQAPPAADPPARDAIEAGRRVIARYSCNACHRIDDGTGGTVGPDFRLAGAKLHREWVEKFLADPRAWGKVYPWRPHRMPKLPLTQEEIRIMADYLESVGKRTPGPRTLPPSSGFDPAKLARGTGFYVTKCSECHTLGNVIPLVPVKQQGPDLLRVAGRVDWNFAHRWIVNPRSFDPNTRMTVPGITPELAEDIRSFVWKTSMEAGYPRDSGG